MFDKSVLIFGCGNILLGDDGFGPAVVERLNREDAATDGMTAASGNPIDICEAIMNKEGSRKETP